MLDPRKHPFWNFLNASYFWFVVVRRRSEGLQVLLTVIITSFTAKRWALGDSSNALTIWRLRQPLFFRRDVGPAERDDLPARPAEARR